MRQSHKFLEAIDMSLYRRYLQQLLVIFTTLVFSSYTIAAVTCDAGFVSDEFAPADYGNLGSNASPPVLGINQLLNGIKNESYIIASNSLNTVATGTLETRGSNFYRPKTLTGGVESFELFQDFTDKAGTRTVSYTFNNKFTEKPQALKNVSLSIYDIDANYARTGIFTGTRYFEFSDQVTITGITSSGTSVIPIRKYSGAGMTTTAPYRQTTTTSDVLCSTDSIDEKCKVSVAFDQPIVRVDVTYGNNPNLEYYDFNSIGNPGDQLINIVFDGYCYQPQPRLTYTKALSTSRKKNTDQFTVQIKDNADNSVVTSGITSVTTTGSNNTVTTGTGTTGTFKVNPTKTYTLTESGSGSTNLADYNALYACRKSGPNGATITTLNPNSLQLTYGDDWTCTVTNGLKSYTFTGYVFNDNGGISSEDKFDTSSTFTGNSAYFNGIYDRSVESGINDINVQIRLTNCSDTTYATTSINEEGKYSFSFPSNFISVGQSGCVVQDEPNEWTYSVDTTANEIPITITEGNYTYDNLNFGEVQINNTALVLEKQQYVHDCSATLNYSSILDNETDPSLGFSEVTAKVDPGQCIAYKITATNRGNIVLNNIVISDTLQKEGVDGATVTSTLADAISTADGFATDRAIGYNGTITTQPFSLNKEAPRSFYFNTQYGTTNGSNP
ncbi:MULTISPECIES: hypothetical protein [unclassified Psychrobacter]|uniref:hypothetical protein n=1 Tax=unclassified Psychrobacter TaxID=196806 RepID=UPI0003FF3E68|nr:MULTISPECIES: hypothetical protein [unclassified Psychrobacter]